MIEKNSLHYLFTLASAESLSRGAHARVGVVTRDKNRARFRRRCCGFEWSKFQPVSAPVAKLLGEDF